MRDLSKINNLYYDDKVIDACSIFGMMDTTGKLFSGKGVIKAIANMHFRGNGLGGGFAVYGLYPQYSDYYAFHIMYLSREGKAEVEVLLKQRLCVVAAEEVPTQPIPAIANPPLVWRYFVKVEPQNGSRQSEDNYIMEMVMKINAGIRDAFVFSSGKNMAVFKGVGYPEEIAEYFCLEQYKGYIWTAHGRFPTNTPGWWGASLQHPRLDSGSQR
jgi:glutamate synthase domain-containing protein 1